jgi:nucleoside-diphosphate-sugar epimerase
MRLLLTGDRGYVGSVAGPILAERHDVVGLDVDYYAGCDLFPGARVPSVTVDVRDVELEHLRGFDAVVHLAALSNDPVGDLDRQLTLDINYASTVRLAEIAKAVGVRRFVFASSCSMYGAGDSSTLVDESGDLAPLTAYAESKVLAERELLALADDAFSPASLRFATAYGVSPRLRLDIVLNNLAGWAVTTGAVRLLSDGSAWRPLIHVADMAAAIQAVLEAPADVVHGKAFNVGSTEANYRVRELADIVAAAAPGTEVELAPGASADTRNYRVDFGLFAGAFPELPFAWTPERGARELVDAYRAAGLLRNELDSGDRFVRLRRLQALQARDELDRGLRRQTVHA